MSGVHYISPDKLTIDQIDQIIIQYKSIELSNDSLKAIKNCRNYLDNKLDQSDELFYGINTGFGSLCNIKISKEEIEQLQSNLVKSHACGTGDEVPTDIVRIMLLLKIQSLSYGFSAITPATIQRLIHFFNLGIIPQVFQQGSLGASGDLAPLAHLSLPLIGEGFAYYKEKLYSAAALLKQFNLSPLRLHSKEGLALLNGTQFSSAYGTWCLIQSKRLSRLADFTAAISLDAFNCRLSPFNEHLHQIRPHNGQLNTAKNIRSILADSAIAAQQKTSVQDPYSFRCIPQVHGASKDTIEYVEKTFTIEINSVTDNPNIFPDSDLILSGGNFHAQPLALPLDFLAIALSELGSISERRTFQLISGVRDLPAFLTANPGLNSGLMIPQYTAASITSQNKQLCTPASVDSIVSSNGQEDHVSMAANAATKVYRIVKNLERILAIEFMTAAQALYFRRPTRSSALIEKTIEVYRKEVPILKEDRVLSIDIKKTVQFLRDLKVDF